jgi:hypothetical protein
LSFSISLTVNTVLDQSLWEFPPSCPRINPVSFEWADGVWSQKDPIPHIAGSVEDRGMFLEMVQWKGKVLPGWGQSK